MKNTKKKRKINSKISKKNHKTHTVNSGNPAVTINVNNDINSDARSRNNEYVELQISI